MTRSEVKRKLDELLETFNPKDDNNIPFRLDKSEYDLIVNTVWQIKSGILEEEKIKRKQYANNIHNNINKEKNIVKLLRKLLIEFDLLNSYLYK